MKRILLLVFVLLQWVSCYSQENDAQLWTNIYLEKKVFRHFYIHLNQETRYTENISRLGFAYGDAGITYKLTEYLNSTLDYVFIEKYYIDHQALTNYYSTRHQFYFNFTFKYDFGPLSVHLREQIQNQVQDIYSSDNGYLPFYYFRNKITFKYHMNKRWQPYIAEEMYFQLSNPEGNEFDRSRTFAGFFYHLTRVDELEAYYLLQKQFHVNNPHTDYIMGIGYAHFFK